MSFTQNYNEELYHYGILGMKWGVRRSKEQLNQLGKKDTKWAKKNSDKITKKAAKKSAKELCKYSKQLMKQPDAVTKSGKLSSKTINAYNKKMVELMNKNVSGLTAPSGRVVQFVAKRGEIGVHMALADAGYDMRQLKNGVYSSGKIAYRNKTADMARI